MFIFLRLRSGFGVSGPAASGGAPTIRILLPQDAGRRPIDKVVPMPQRPTDATPPRPGYQQAGAATSGGSRWKDIADAGSPATAGLDAIAAADPGFDGKHFIAGARAAYGR